MKFSMIGTGNAAWHFSEMLRMQGHQLLQVCARNPEHAEGYEAHIIDQETDLTDENDLVIIAVKDDAIGEVSARVKPHHFTIHTSGATSIDVLTQAKTGVVWPVQTLKKFVPTDYSMMPFLIEGSGEKEAGRLQEIFGSVSSKTYLANSEQRAKGHMAVVFANNFTTQMLDIASQLLAENNLPPDLALPSLRELADKLATLTPSEVQTGPARRADMQTIRRHLSFLEGQPELQELYTLLTNRILGTFHGRKL